MVSSFLRRTNYPARAQGARAALVMLRWVYQEESRAAVAARPHVGLSQDVALALRERGAASVRFAAAPDEAALLAALDALLAKAGGRGASPPDSLIRPAVRVGRADRASLPRTP